MSTLTKVVLTFDDGSTQEFDAATPAPVETIADVKVENTDGTSETFTPAQ